MWNCFLHFIGLIYGSLRALLNIFMGMLVIHLAAIQVILYPTAIFLRDNKERKKKPRLSNGGNEPFSIFSWVEICFGICFVRGECCSSGQSFYVFRLLDGVSFSRWVSNRQEHRVRAENKQHGNSFEFAQSISIMSHRPWPPWYHASGLSFKYLTIADLN